MIDACNSAIGFRALADIKRNTLMAIQTPELADGQTGESAADKSAAFDIEGVLKKAEDLAQGDELITKVAGQVRETAAANSKAVCYWQYYCYYNGWCEYAYACW